MSFETISLLLNWMQMGALLAILFRLSYTFELIANTQRELRRAIHHLGERRAAQLGLNSGSGGLGFARLAPDHSKRTIDIDDLARESPEIEELRAT